MKPLCLFAVAPLALVLAAGCSHPDRTTVMTVDDYEYIASQIGEKLHTDLVSAPLLAERKGDSPRWTIAVQKVQNLTSDVMSEGTKWYLMARVCDSAPIATLKHEKNIVFTIPADRLREARKHGAVPDDMASERKPTHVMSATFISVTRAAGKDRTDLYHCEYSLTDLKSGEVVWTDKVEFKRAAHGRSWD